MEVIGKTGTAIIYTTDHPDSGAIAQVYDILSTEMTRSEKIRIMPDFHKGSGCVIGYTQTYSGGPIDPETIGVDLGCGVLSVGVKLKKSLPDLGLLDHRIRTAVPIGSQEIHTKPILDEKKFRKFMKTGLENLRSQWPEYLDYQGLGEIDKYITQTLRRIGMDKGVFYKSISTLGSSNHFIELGRVKEDPETLWITIHTGSRGLGAKVFSYWSKAIQTARPIKEEIKKAQAEIKARYPRSEVDAEIKKLRQSGAHHISPSKLIQHEEDIKGYLKDLGFACIWASYNRALISELVMKIIGGKISERIESVHNYLDPIDRVIRKGAIRAGRGDKVVIPLNMAAGVLVCEGLGNSEWNNSAPHGTGRRMSRGEAKRTLGLEQFKESMGPDIYSSCITEACLDESPGAYKDPEPIITQISGVCVNLVCVIKPILSIKPR